MFWFYFEMSSINDKSDHDEDFREVTSIIVIIIVIYNSYHSYQSKIDSVFIVACILVTFIAHWERFEIESTFNILIFILILHKLY